MYGGKIDVIRLYATYVLWLILKSLGVCGVVIARIIWLQLVRLTKEALQIIQFLYYYPSIINNIIF